MQNYAPYLLYLVPPLLLIKLLELYKFKIINLDSQPANHPMNINQELSELFNEMWQADYNACISGRDYELDMQGVIHNSRSRQDRAQGNLFQWLDAKVFERPTYRGFCRLLDNYDSEVGKVEVFTEEEKKETSDFLDAILSTAVMQLAHSYLIRTGHVSADARTFKSQLFDLWFRLYKRNRESKFPDSCGFEHVFIGETRQDAVIGFHNWIQFYLMEKAGKVNYMGFYTQQQQRHTAASSTPRVISLQFSINGKSFKDKGSVFIGTSPEFEIALYTVAFFQAGGVTYEKKQQKTVFAASPVLPASPLHVIIEDYTVEIVTHHMARHQIGSCYPKLLR